MKILVVRVGRAGDTVMITPALSALLDLYPDAELHVLVGPDGQRVLKGFDKRLVRMIVYDRKTVNSYLVRKRLNRDICRENYSHIYCFELKSSFYKLFSGSSAQIHRMTTEHEQLHYAARCLRVVAQGQPVAIANKWLYLPVSEQGRRKAAAVLQEAGITEDDFLVGLHPSFSGLRKAIFRSSRTHHLREWPVASFGTLAQLLTDHAAAHGIPLRIIADILPDEKALGEAVVRASHGHVTLIMPPPDFERYKATLQHMDLLITPNTGPMHIAGALGTNMVALFAGMSPSDCGPYVPDDQYVVLRAEDTAEPEKGIAAIDPATVFKACLGFFPR